MISKQGKGITLLELLVTIAILGFISISLFKFFNTIMRNWMRTESLIQIYKTENMMSDNFFLTLKNIPPLKPDSVTDTSLFFISKQDKYIDFYSDIHKDFISDLSSSGKPSLENPEILRFTTLLPPITPDTSHTLNHITYLVGNDKYLYENTNPDNIKNRKKFRLFRSQITEILDDKFNDDDSLNSETVPYYLRDFGHNVTSMNLRFYNSVNDNWVADDWSETYLPAAVEVKLYISDDNKNFGNPEEIASGQSSSFIITIPCEHN